MRAPVLQIRILVLILWLRCGIISTEVNLNRVIAMKWMLIIVIVFSLITIFEMHKEYKQSRLSRKTYTIIAAMEGAAAAIALVLLFVL